MPPPPFFDGEIGGDLHLFGELQRLVHLIYAVALDVILPAMEDAAQTAFFVAPQPQGGSPVGAELVDQTNTTVGVTEGHQVLAQ